MPLPFILDASDRILAALPLVTRRRIRQMVCHTDRDIRANACICGSESKEIGRRSNGTAIQYTSLARAVGCHPSRLRSSFKLSFGISIREYQTRRQVLQAARLLMSSTEKVDAVARATGFKSRKNFYAAFRRLAGTTPTAIRHWSHSDLESLERRLTLHSDFKNAIT
jgi:AraC-like DNA-binding protein